MKPPSDEPHFPAPSTTSDASPYREARAAPPRVENAPKKIGVRPEPPRDEAHANATTKLSPEELRALLAVESALGGRWRSCARRSTIFLPIGLLSALLRAIFGPYALFATTLAALIALVWIARPLFKDDGFT